MVSYYFEYFLLFVFMLLFFLFFCVKWLVGCGVLLKEECATILLKNKQEMADGLNIVIYID